MTEQKPITQADLDMIARLNTERFSADDLLEVSDLIHDLPPEARNWEGRMFFLAKRFRGQHYRLMAIDYRLTAMAEIIAKNVLPLGVLPQAADDSHTVSECVFEAAAVEPILMRKNDPFFEPNSFLRRVLELSDTDGKA